MSLLWIIARSSGLMAVALLSAVIALGILSSADFGPRRWSRFVTNGLHRRLAYLACAMLGLHILAIVADSYVTVNLIDVVVPFSSSYERIAVGLGALAFDAMVVLVATSLARRYLPFSMWQVVHVAAYAIWPLAILHGLLAGTDDLLALGISMAGALAVGSVALFRIFSRATPRPAARATAAPQSPSATRVVVGEPQRDTKALTPTP